MTSVQVIHYGHSKRRRSLMSCCFCMGAKKSSSNLSIDAEYHEPYEYVVEKLIIKRVPVKRFGTVDLKKPKPSLSMNTINEIKPIVTFSSYCQVGPTVVHKTPISDGGVKDSPGRVNLQEEDFKEPLAEIGGAGDKLIRAASESPREVMTSGRREQLQQCSKNMNTAQVYKASLTPKTSPPNPLRKSGNSPDGNRVLFTKPMSSREADPKEMPRAVKETIQILANKSPNMVANRRLVTRDPETGQIKEIFQNVKIDKPVKLEEIYQEDQSPEIVRTITPATRGPSARLSSPAPTVQPEETPPTTVPFKQRLKWKIIIRHKNDKKKKSPQRASSSDFVTDTEI